MSVFAKNPTFCQKFQFLSKNFTKASICFLEMPINSTAPVEQLLADVADFSPVLPDAVTQLLLNRSGLDTEADPRIARIAALAAQKVKK